MYKSFKRQRERDEGPRKSVFVPHQTVQEFLLADCTLIDKKKQRKLEILACVSDTEVAP